MMSTRTKLLIEPLVCILVTLAQPVAAMAVQELVSSGVSSVVRDAPSADDSTPLWTTALDCSHIAGDERRPALINRASLAVASPCRKGGDMSGPAYANG